MLDLATVCPLAAGPRTFAPATMVGAELLLATVPVRVQDTHGTNAFGQITQDEPVVYGFA